MSAEPLTREERDELQRSPFTLVSRLGGHVWIFRYEATVEALRRDLHEILGLLDDPSRDDTWLLGEIAGICEQGLRR